MIGTLYDSSGEANVDERTVFAAPYGFNALMKFTSIDPYKKIEEFRLSFGRHERIWLPEYLLRCIPKHPLGTRVLGQNPLVHVDADKRDRGRLHNLLKPPVRVGEFNRKITQHAYPTDEQSGNAQQKSRNGNR